MIPVYIGSKLKYADRWKRLRADWKKAGIFINSTWIDQAVQEDDSLPADFRIFWSVDQRDVSQAAFVVIYGEPKDELRGALVEAGIAIATGAHVIVVGDCSSFGTWQHHPACIKVATLEHAKRLILNFIQFSK